MKFILFLLPILCLGQAIQLTPNNPVATAGAPITITADRPVRFTLSGAGSISATSGTATTYTAPVALSQPHVLNGCMVTPADSIYNTPIDKLPVDPNSAAWVPNMAASSGLFLSNQWGTNVVDNAVQMVPLYFHYTTYLNGVLFPSLPNPMRRREAGAYTNDGSNDHHMLTMNHQSCQFYETYQDGIAVDGCPTCNAASGLTYASTNYNQPYGEGSTDAAGLPLAPLTVHLDELESGVINHPLRFTSCAGCISHQVLWPAITSTGWTPTGAPMGARFRLKASFDVSSYPPAAQTLLNAMKRYGLILADIGLMGDITLASDVTRDPRVMQQLSAVNGLTADNFDVVDESSLMLNPNLNVVNPNNPYVHPANSAILTVTDIANPSNTLQVPIALQPVTVGTPEPLLTVQAGTDPFAIQSWVNGASNSDVTWTISPSLGAGSITSDGTYTAPALIGGVTYATLTATSVADPTASATVSLTLIPGGPLRIDSGSPTPTTDENGNTWLQDLGFETGSSFDLNDWYPVNAWGGIPLQTQFQSYKYTWGDDLVYRLHVPNGTYQVALMFGQGGQYGPYNTGVWDSGLIWGGLDLESQGQVAKHDWNFGIPANFQSRTPVTVTIPAKVTDTSLIVALRALNNTIGHTVPFLNGITVMPDSSAPHLAVDSQHHLVMAGQVLQLHVTDWFSGSANITWRILTGPGRISSSGLYAAPLHVTKGQWVVVRARDSVTGLSATFNLYVPAAGDVLPAGIY